MKASRQRDRSAVILLIAGVVLFGLCSVCILAQSDPPEPPPPPPGPKPFWFIIEGPPEHGTLSKDGVMILPDKYPFWMLSDQTPLIEVRDE